MVDQADYLKNKGYVILDTQWFGFWDFIEFSIEKFGKTEKDQENACMQLRKQDVFKTLWECINYGKLFADGKHGELMTYEPESKKI